MLIIQGLNYAYIFDVLLKKHKNKGRLCTLFVDLIQHGFLFINVYVYWNQLLRQILKCN
jgi:hypothetical protein